MKKDIAIMIKTDVKKNEGGYQVFVGDDENPKEMEKLSQEDLLDVLELLAKTYSEINNRYTNICKLCSYYKNYFPHCMPDSPEIVLGTGRGNDNIISCDKFEDLREE